MKTVLGWIFNRWVLLAVVLLALALAIWLIGPMVAIGELRPLESESARWITIGAILLVVAARIAWGQWRKRRGNAAVVKELMTAPPAAQAGEVESADMKAVRERFEKAMVTLRRARFGSGGLLAGWSARLNGRYLYELPWYLIIGAPGSGKTTALLNCGLKFPLAQQGADQALRGVGGTRHCDWWFTDQAVLIDTAGRFTTHEDDPQGNRATWDAFLGLLKRSRPRQPVNGVLITVSISDLIGRGAAERQHYAQTVRQRVHELHEQWGIQFPIYMMVTKTDLLAGFTDYFGTIDKEQRTTPWGATFPLEGSTTEHLQRFGGEFDALLQRVDQGLIERLQQERDVTRRARIYGFANQFGGLKPALQEFLDTVFAPSPYEAQAMLRGVYFISGTQDGTPIDRVLSSIARSHRLASAAVAANVASGKSYFLERLLGEVVFTESGLAGTNLKWERRRGLLMMGAYASLGVVTVGLLAAWGVSYFNNRRYVDEVAQRADQVRKLVQGTPNRASPDILPVVPALAATRGLAGGGKPVPWSMGYGLAQMAMLDNAARTAYDHMLVDAVLPRLGLRVEEQLRQAGDGGVGEYEALKTYLMLHDVAHFDGAALKRYFERDWDAQLDRSVDSETRADLSRHLDALLAQGAAVSPLPEDKVLVETHRNRLAQVSLPQRIHDRLRQQGLGAEFPEFTAVGKAGDKATLVFTRASGQPLTRGVPGLYTYDGYWRGFQKEVKNVADQLAAEEPWVLNIAERKKTAATLLGPDDGLIDAVRRIHLNQYASIWEAYIKDLRLVPMASLAQSIQLARMLSAPDSPLPVLMKAIARETTLLASDNKNLAEKAGDKVSDVMKKGQDYVANALSTKKPDTTGPRIESIVDDRFSGIRSMVAPGEGGRVKIDDTVALIAEVYSLLNAADIAIKGGTAPPPSPVPLKVKSEAARLPEPLHAMLDDLSQSSSKVSQVMVRQNLGNEVKSQVGEFCQQALAGRYPLDRNAARDATQADFASLFAPGGKMDQLFQQKLAPYVDTTTRPWRFRAVEGVPLGADSGTLPQFQRAQAIRETFFPSGNTPTLRLQFKPVEMDASLRQFILDVDGTIVRYDHGPQIPTTVVWPGPRGSSQVRLQLSPPVGAADSGMLREGPWALFRLFDKVNIQPTGAPERFRATFDVDGRKAVFEITASSVHNPFRLPELAEFRCPTGL